MAGLANMPSIPVTRIQGDSEEMKALLKEVFTEAGITNEAVVGAVSESVGRKIWSANVRTDEMPAMKAA